MSRSKRNWDHLIDDYGNYKASASPIDTHEAFCSFDGNNAEYFYGGFNIDRIVRESRGVYTIYFAIPFPHKFYNVLASFNGGIRRGHHLAVSADSLVLTVRDTNNTSVDDSFISIRAFLAL